MNPFTRFLSQWLPNRRLHEFSEQWDALERIVVRVYREKMTPAEAETDFQRVWPWLRQHYSTWEMVLRPYWQQTQAGGRPTQADPFRLLLDVAKPADILGDWNLMQHLPAAREALNQLIIDQSGER